MILATLSLVWLFVGVESPRSRAPDGIELALTASDRWELADRQAVVEARVDEFARQMVTPCSNLHEFVRVALSSVDRIGAVNAGPIVLTSNPPKLRVSYVVALTDGRLVPDEVIAVVPLEARVWPAEGKAFDGRPRQCGGTVLGG